MFAIIGAMKKLIHSMSEPRSVTAVMVVIYTAISVTGLGFLTSYGSLPWTIILAALLMLVSGVLGAPSAWLGSWWLEGPAALVAVLGIMLVSINELVLTTAHVRWPLHVIILSVIIALFFFARALRVWPYSYRPGVLPKSKLEEAEERYNKTREEYLSTVSE